MRMLYFICIAGLLSACMVAEASKDAVAVDMRNVALHLSDDITLHVTRLQGHFVAVGRSSPFLDNKRWYTVDVDAGEIALDLDSLNHLMARSLGGDKSNLRKVRVWFNPDGTLGQSGVIDSKVNVPFRSKAVVSATSDGRIRVSTTSVSSKGVPLTPVMKVLGFHMDSLVKVAPGTGVVTEGNDFILDPSQLLPAPAVRGRVTAVRIANNRLVQTFGSGDAPPEASGLSPNHIYWRNGELAFGKLTMTETDSSSWTPTCRTRSTSPSITGTSSSSRATRKRCRIAASRRTCRTTTICAVPKRRRRPPPAARRRAAAGPAGDRASPDKRAPALEYADSAGRSRARSPAAATIARCCP